MRQGRARLSEEQVRVVNGLLHDRGTPVWRAEHRSAWERDHAVHKVVDESIARARRGGRGAATQPRDRPPRWLGTLAAGMLAEAASTYYTWGGAFRFVRRLERLGLLDIPHDDVWVLAALSGVDVQCSTQEVLDYLAGDPELRDELVWRLFEVEGGGRISLANVDSFGEAAWRGAFLALVADATLPRDRVLDACLEALARDFNRYTAKWFVATWEALEPTPRERLARQDLMLPVLRASAPPVVSFAVRELVRAQRTGSLDATTVVPALDAAVQSSAKGTALAALRLAAAVAADDPTADVAALARSGLEHPHPDVQAAAAHVLASLGDDDTLVAAAGSLSPSVRDGLGLATTSSRSSSPTVPYVPPPPVGPPGTDAEVVDLAASLLEDASDPFAVEALLQALAARRGGTAIHVLAKRARTVAARPTDHGGPPGVPHQVARLVLLAAGQPSPVLPGSFVRPRAALLHLEHRFDEVADVLAGLRPPAPLLATPDLPGGLLSPGVLLSRLGDRVELPPADLAAALLRLADDPAREDLLRRLAPLTTPDVAALARRPRHGPAARSRIESWPDDFWWTDRDGRRRVERSSDWRLVTDGPPDGPTSLEEPQRVVLEDWLGLMALMLPHDAEHFAALAHGEVFVAARHSGAWYDAPRVLDLLAAHTGRHGELSATVVAVGLATARGDQRVHAVDALVDLTTSGRLAADQVADALVRHGPVLPAPRWAESLAAAGVVTGPHLPIEVLTRVLPSAPTDLRGLHAPLGVLLDESLRAGQRVADPELRDWLGRLHGSSKAARTARRLLAG